MSNLDWAVLALALAFITGYGLWRGRGSRNLQDYLLAGRQMRWFGVTLSIMATQASAITFISTPGQAYTDGLRFIQFYLALPLAMIILCITAIPLYKKLNVYTAYEYLEGRFDRKTRSLAAFLFLVQRGLATGLTLYAPALILSLLLGWDIRLTILAMGGLAVLYTVTGGARAVNRTQQWQMAIIWLGMGAAFTAVLWQIPAGVSFGDALGVAGSLGKLNAIDFSFDLQNRYNIWSGLIGGLFLFLSYFGTDHSQVQRYLSGQSVSQIRTALLMNGLLKVPLQFFILLTGIMVFVGYQFLPPPVFFNPVETARIRQGPAAGRFAAVETEYRQAWGNQQEKLQAYLAARRTEDPAAAGPARTALQEAHRKAGNVRQEAVRLIEKSSPAANPNDSNYVFLTFVLSFLPAGLVGLVLAVAFAAAMSSLSAELNSLAAVTIVDFWRRFRPRSPAAAESAAPPPAGPATAVQLSAGPAGAADRRELWISRLATLFWALVAIWFAESAGRLGTLVEAVNVLGSLFYGTILGIFLSAFYIKRVHGGIPFYAALAAQAVVFSLYFFTPVSFLWYNLAGCGLVTGISWLASHFPNRPSASCPASPPQPGDSMAGGTWRA